MKRLALLCTVVILVLTLTGTVSAAASNTYVYDANDKAVAVPEPYRTAAYLDGSYAGVPLKAPTDLCVDRDGFVFILDAGNNRLVKLNKELDFVAEIRLTKDGQPVAFADAQGVFAAENGTLYIADKKAQKVYVADASGHVTGEILAPPADKVEDGFEYTPISVIADTAGIVYVISSGSYTGALQYDQSFRFLGFYGTERVIVTPTVLLNEFWKKILSETAAAGLTRNVPTSIIAMDIDEGNFVYTLRGGSAKSQSGQVRKLNTLGTNILLDGQGKEGRYGDLDTYQDSSKNLTVASDLNDLTVDDQGFITVLDRTYNRLFQYSQTTEMLYAFGGKESRFGNFSSPVAVEALGDKLLVLDDDLCSLTVLEPTDFALCVRRAISLNQDGKYVESAPYWEKVLAYDTYYELANNGMGAVCQERGEYTQAMTYYKLAHNQDGYSSAFAEVRDHWIKEHFLLLLSGAVALLLSAVVGVNYAERHRRNYYALHLKPRQYPLYCLRHPFKGYYEMKVTKQGSLTASFLILTCFFVLSILQERLTAFHFSDAGGEQFNVLLTAGRTIGIFVLFVFCNWASSTLADGEGTLKEIWIFSSYSLIPYCMTIGAMTAISRVLSLEEAAFWSAFWVIGIGWTLIHAFVAIKEVHQFTVKRTVGILLVTVLGMYLMLLVITLAYSLLIQLLGFISTIISEYRLK